MTGDRSRAPDRPQARRLVAATACTIAFVVAACSLPVDQQVTRYANEDLPADIANTTTTTTTSTTTTSTTLPGDETVPDDVTTTSTTPVVADLEPIRIYYTVGLSDQLQPLTLQRPPPITAATVIDLLQSPTGVADFGLRSSVRFGLVGPIEIERATAVVPLDEDVLDRMPDSEQRRAIAQIVLTLTSFQPPDQGNIGFVRFEVDGDDYSVYVPALGGSSSPGDELAYSDFAALVVGITPDESTGTTTTSSTIVESGGDGEG